MGLAPLEEELEARTVDCCSNAEDLRGEKMRPS